MSRSVAVTLMGLGLVLVVAGVVTGYTVGVISDNPLAEDGVPRVHVTLLLGCAATTAAAGGIVAVLGLFARPVPHAEVRAQSRDPDRRTAA
ncbi:hypothetical protein [Cellulosimicrobium funkei]|uniref:Uncharacterized protein n=1 Tax=Cellulosimicrobium funkei TaxID=264251 RepID=A0A4Y8R102_9MICO|nr:hypothetical protein [Cellulosimicrobium funkei]TFF07891.1 hypothetical protein E1O70_14650 [Cellulosimicrobium funkei]TGA71085.1 hypothetical protein EQW79_012835 [Cellulosimicrobium terreum]